MKFKILLAIGLFTFALKANGQEAAPNGTERSTPIEWGNATKVQSVLVQEIKKPGLMNTPLSINFFSVKNLVSGVTYYYTRFEGYDIIDKANKISAVNEEELDELLGFCKNLSEYVKETKIPMYTEYEYVSKDRDLRIGAYWSVKDITWNFYVKIDPVARRELSYYYDTSYISQLYSVLLSAKATIERMKREGK